MSDLIFSLLISLVFFSNVLLSPGLLMVIFDKIFSDGKVNFLETIDHGFVLQFIIQIVLYLLSVSLIYLHLYLASKKKEIVKNTSYIFGIPMIVTGMLALWGVFDSLIRSFKYYDPYGFSAGMLALLIGMSFMVLLLIFSSLYFFMVRSRIMNRLLSVSQNDDQLAKQSKFLEKFLMIIGICITSYVFIYLRGYYMVRNKQTTLDPQSSVQQTENLPEGWSYKDNGECGVKFAIPPIEEPYYSPLDPDRQPSVTDDVGSGRFWNFPKGETHSILLPKLTSGWENERGVVAMYSTVDEASGYVPAGVAVSCVPNDGDLDNEHMLSNIQTALHEYNLDTGEKVMEADEYVIQTVTKGNRWGYDVLDITLSEYFSNAGGEPYTRSSQHTVFATPIYLYEIEVFGASEDLFVKNTALEIFNNLVF